MTEPDTYWRELEAAYETAFASAFGREAERFDVLLAMLVAELETQNGRAWPGTWNFGAVQLRALTADELAHYHAGTLKAGDTFPGNPGGVLHVDTHPTTSGPQFYPVWFAAFPTRLDGIRYFLKSAVYATAGELAAAHTGDDAKLARAMYLRGYYEGGAPGARPWWQRTEPLNAAEEKNVAAYAHAMDAHRSAITAALGWTEPESEPATGEIVHDSAGVESASCTNVGTDERLP